MTHRSINKVYVRLLISGFLIIPALLTAAGATATTSWPKIIKTDKGDITVYQPTPETLDGTTLSGRAAVSVKSKDSKRPVFGAIWITSTLVTDRETRIAVLKDIKIPNIRFSDDIDSAVSSKITRLIEEEMPKWNLEVSMDDLVSTLENANVKSDAKFKNDPPEIIIANKPSVLVYIDGEPRLKALEGYDYQKVQNTPFFVIFDPKDKEYFIYGDQVWYEAKDIQGPWEYLKKPASSLKKLQEDIEKTNNPQGKESSGKSKEKKEPESVPDVIVRSTPAELIVINGEPEFTPITATNLLYVKNTDDNVFMDIQSQNYYILISGRWYTAPKMTGPWSFSDADKLPEEFKKIPEGTEKDAVLASVAGTEAAREAVLDSQIPQTAEVDRKTATVKVEYDGEPKFEKVDGTEMVYAVNSPQTVLKVSNKYYCVDNGIWFEATAPKGPWQVATSRPAQVDNIEPSSPVYNVKYVYVYDVTPEVVYVGYTPGYTGSYVYGPTVVYGTGYPYVPWYGAYYYPRPVTYGFSMHYNPYTGWGMSFGMSYGPIHVSFGGGGYYGGYWGCPGYHPPYHYPPHHGGGYYPPHGGYPGGSQPPGSGRPPDEGRPGTNPPSAGNQPSTRPSRPGSSGSGNQVSNNMYANNRSGVNPNISNSARGTGTGRNPSVSQQPNNVYTDRNGNVYQKTNSGWEQRQGNSWQSTDKAGTRDQGSRNQSNISQPSARPANNQVSSNVSSSNRSSSYNRSDLDQQSASRSRGQTRTNSSSSYSRPSGSSSRSYSGGGSRGGGGGGRRR